MYGEERDRLQEILDNGQDRFKRLKIAVMTGALIWSVSMMLFGAGWWVVSWLLERLADVDIWFDNPSAVWILAVGGVTTLAYAIGSSVRWLKGLENLAPSIRADLANGQVVVEELAFGEAKCMQEQEHGGLIYFLRSSDDRVLVVYDYESQDLGVQGDGPEGSSFRPRMHLTVVRAPQSGLVVGKSFSGDALKVAEVIDLVAPPDQWPEDADFCDIPWAELEARLSV